MRIVVCIKQVPDPEQISFVETGQDLVVVEPFEAYRMNRFDEFAMEAALELKERLSPEISLTVIALTVGPQRSRDVLRRAMGMGADDGIHLELDEQSASDPALVAYHITDYLRQHPFDLILCGAMSEDDMNGHVGPMIAAGLDLPFATQVIGLDLLPDRAWVAVQREIEGGGRANLELRLPALLAVQSGINRPRYPSLSNLLRANRQSLEKHSVASDVVLPSAIQQMETFLPVRNRSLHMLEGTTREKAQQLLTVLREKAFVQ